MTDKAFLAKLSTRILNTPLMINRTKLEVILSAVGDRIGLETAVADAKSSAKTNRPQRSSESDSVAIIKVYDSLVYRTQGLSAWSGLTSYEQIRDDFRTALNDQSIKAIVFDMDSPGGEVAGVFDLVDEIHKARGQKPIYAIANESAYSAAYAIASAADKIYLSRTAGVGSIGVIAMHVDQSERNEKTGLSFTPIFAGSRKNDFSPHAPLSDEAQKIAQESVNEAYDLFVATVARNRDLSEDAVRKTEAGIFKGNNAVNAGLADAVMSWDQALKDIISKTGEFFMKDVRAQMEAALSNGSKKVEAVKMLSDLGFVQKSETMSAEDVEKAKMESMDTGRAEGKKEAMNRINGIMELCNLADMPQMATSLLNSDLSVEDARKKILDAKASGDRSTEIWSTVSATGIGEANPLLADAKRRAGKEG